MVPKWRAKKDKMVAEAEAAASEIRCPKTGMIRTGVGDFVDFTVTERCFLDKGHFGSCVFSPREVERMKADPRPKTAADVIEAYDLEHAKGRYSR